MWERGIDGTGVVVTVVDDGIEHSHPDLTAAYDSAASLDVNGDDPDPFPNRANPINNHGTRCAGVVAAAVNGTPSVCGVGVAYGAKIGGIRMLDGDVTDSVEAAALSYRPDYIDIYTSSWGPNDDGRTIEGPSVRTQQALANGVAHGRGGKGSIFLFASGNGGYADSCNCDGYTNSAYTVTIGGIGGSGVAPYYTEPCAATIAVAFSSWDSGAGSTGSAISTTDLYNRCISSFSGTSAATPVAAGIVALMLQANPALTWRDVQHIIVHAAVPTDPTDSGWRENAGGLAFNLKYGFGRMELCCDCAVTVL